MNVSFKRACTSIAATAALVFLSLPASLVHMTPAHASCSDDAGQGVNWEDCRKRNLIMSGFDFSGSNFTRADLSSSDLRDTTLDGSSFEKTNLVRASLKGASAPGANFSGVLASRTNFSEANFAGANFEKAETFRVDFSNSDLSNVNMSRAEFGRAMFAGADITGVSFDFTNLARADLRGVKFSTPPSFDNTFLFQTRLDGLDLSQASGLQQWQISLSCGDADTQLPDGLERPATWPCAEEE